MLSLPIAVTQRCPRKPNSEVSVNFYPVLRVCSDDRHQWYSKFRIIVLRHFGFAFRVYSFTVVTDSTTIPLTFGPIFSGDVQIYLGN